MKNKKKPYMIKPNQFELEQFCGKKFDLDNNFDAELEKIRQEIKKIYEETGVIVLCTLGEYGGLYCGGEGIYYKNAPKVELKGFTGAGDTFLTAFCAVYFGLFNLPEGSGAECALKFAVAASAAKVRKPGTEFAAVDEIFALAREHGLLEAPAEDKTRVL
jgi:fructose-1-phosphate kinase PfkB-like protein